jgi:hypothetical protein
MGQDRDVTGADAGHADDFEYDSAHDATTGPNVAADATHENWQRVPVQAKSDADDGDYGYDLAHDM